VGFETRKYSLGLTHTVQASIHPINQQRCSNYTAKLKRQRLRTHSVEQ